MNSCTWCVCVCVVGYVSGLQELYARRVGLFGCIPAEFGELSELRVLSLGTVAVLSDDSVIVTKIYRMSRE